MSVQHPTIIALCPALTRNWIDRLKVENSALPGSRAAPGGPQSAQAARLEPRPTELLARQTRSIASEKVGKLRPESPLKQGMTYRMIFPNPTSAAEMRPPP